MLGKFNFLFSFHIKYPNLKQQEGGLLGENKQNLVGIVGREQEQLPHDKQTKMEAVYPGQRAQRGKVKISRSSPAFKPYNYLSIQTPFLSSKFHYLHSKRNMFSIPSTKAWGKKT